MSQPDSVRLPSSILQEGSTPSSKMPISGMNNGQMLPSLSSNCFPNDRSFLRCSQPGLAKSQSTGSSNPSSSALPFFFGRSEDESKPFPSLSPFSSISNASSTSNRFGFMLPNTPPTVDRDFMKNQLVAQNSQGSEVLFSEVERMDELCTLEKKLLTDFKDAVKNIKTSISSVDIQSVTRKFYQEMTALAQKKLRAMRYVLQTQGISNADEIVKVPLQTPTSGPLSMQIAQQPSETAVANRYLLPAPQLYITPNTITQNSNSTFVVSVKLAYHGESETELESTFDGKQDVLQGIKRVTVDSDNQVTFTKLKVMDVSSKHKHQPFCLVFTLEEYQTDGKKTVQCTVKTAPFHVQSRPSKRKSTGSLPPAKRFMSDVQQQDSFTRRDTTVSLPNIPTIQSESESRKALVCSAGARDNTSDQCNYIDITDLLVLPQKEAARQLGISESMLCKRFKECTRRKWPYRYLRKIEKVITMLEAQKADGAEMTPEDEEKLASLSEQREECLKPVRIRITSYDKMTANASRPLLLTTAPPNHSATSSPSVEEDEETDEDETLVDDSDAVETLQTLKNAFSLFPTREKPTL